MHMTKIKKLSLLGILAVMASVASADTTEEDYVKSYQSTNSREPIPLVVVTPKTTLSTEGHAEVSFLVNAKGEPSNIVVRKATDQALVEPVTEAIQQWKFEPAKRNGESVPCKVILPIRFVSND